MRTIPFWVIAVGSLLFIVASSNPSLSIFILFCIYAVSGFAYQFWLYWTGRPNPVLQDIAAHQQETEEEHAA